MFKFTKLIISVLFFLCTFSSYTYANVAMPGFWNVGTGREFIPVFKKEEILIKNIRMDSELVTVYLYENFAVVKGEYNMYNTLKKTVTLHVGYPENGVYQNKVISNIIFNNLEYLKVSVDDKWAENKFLSSSDELEKIKEIKNRGSWHIFQVTFKPQAITKIKVYYLVDTHSASLRKGYDREESKGFSYILESGQIWLGTIVKGRIYIKLFDELSDKNIIGLLPEKAFKYDKENKVLVYDFTDLEPSNDSNIVIRYKGTDDNKFDLSKLNAQNYYSQIDKADSSRNISNQLVEIEKNNFNVFPSFQLYIYMILLILISIPIFIIIIIVKLLRRRTAD